MTEAQQHEVWILWGTPGAAMVKGYQFSTANERAAFLLGVDEAAGRWNYQVFNHDYDAHAALSKIEQADS